MSLAAALMDSASGSESSSTLTSSMSSSDTHGSSASHGATVVCLSTRQGGIGCADDVRCPATA
eukprot:12077309-Karenia_brevis.AAC.1